MEEDNMEGKTKKQKPGSFNLNIKFKDEKYNMKFVNVVSKSSAQDDKSKPLATG